ncbi:MAG: hypothetical protein A2512_11990 [Deltaproteobacteria bacterium RIFOXYD12_FULL_56_24]|nr:MAG: hypothetical protein A2512_11990 [Deltaproteobacteria bacterium RIFOXYD12_FULL_56_24]
MNQFFFTPEAEAELAESFAWYESRSPGLGAEFIRAVEAAVTSAAHSPSQYQAWRRSARRVLLRKFPFALFYTVSDSGIVVFACFHGRRDPTILINRQ